MIADSRVLSRHESICNARAELDEARQAHMRAIQRSLAAGMPADEVNHDTASFGRAAQQLVTICTLPTGQAPMLLRPAF